MDSEKNDVQNHGHELLLKSIISQDTLYGIAVCYGNIEIYATKTVTAKLALVGVAQWTECWPAKQRVSSLIPSLGHMPGLWARSPVGGAQEATMH